MAEIISYNEILGRQQDAMIDNFYSGFTRGPYTVKKYRSKRWTIQGVGGEPLRPHTHCVFDGHNCPVIVGTQQECENFAERFNISYAKHLMLKESGS